MPDRIVLLPKGKFAFIELKAPNKKPRPLQVARHKLLMGLGFEFMSLMGWSKLEVLLMKYEPHSYQKSATDFIERNSIAALLLDMGLGKTSITLTAINNLLFDYFDAHRVLVIAPLRKKI